MFKTIFAIFLNSFKIMYIALFYIILKILKIFFFRNLYFIINEMYYITHSNNNVNKIIF